MSKVSEAPVWGRGFVGDSDRSSYDPTSYRRRNRDGGIQHAAQDSVTNFSLLNKVW